MTPTDGLMACGRTKMHVGAPCRGDGMLKLAKRNSQSVVVAREKNDILLVKMKFK
jgi:hypothetical protein